jgi:hypothetical protein
LQHAKLAAQARPLHGAQCILHDSDNLDLGSEIRWE